MTARLGKRERTLKRTTIESNVANMATLHEATHYNRIWVAYDPKRAMASTHKGASVGNGAGGSVGRRSSCARWSMS